MGTARKTFKIRHRRPVPALLLGAAALVSGGCGQTAKTVTPASASQVFSYFGGPFVGSGTTSGSLSRSVATFDHAANQFDVAAFIVHQGSQVPTEVLNGGFSKADTGFLSLTENFAPDSSGVMVAQNPPITGAWAVEVAGAGAMANFLNVTNSGGSVTVRAAPAATALDSACPDFPSAVSFSYVTVPNAALTRDNADYGTVSVTTQGSDVTFAAQPFLVGSTAQPALTGTGACSDTNLGSLTAYPLNSFGTPSNLDLISMGSSGLLASNFTNGAAANSLGAFGGGNGVLGVAQPPTPVDVQSLAAAKYDGFLFAPLNTVAETYDITMLAAAFGNHTAGSAACSALQASLTANNGRGANTVAALPSANGLFGGEFLSASGGGTVNDPTGTNGSENCDVAIDLGVQDSSSNGLFPHATVFIGSTFPPFSSSQPWNCTDTGSVCAVSFPAAAVVGQVKGQYVIFVAASASSTPAASLPDAFSNRHAQPVGIYLFQKPQ